MLCGATMVLDQNGNLIHWARKPGSVSVGDRMRRWRNRPTARRRRTELLDTIAARVAAGMIGETIGGELGLLERASPPFTRRSSVDGTRSLRPGAALLDSAAMPNTTTRETGNGR